MELEKTFTPLAGSRMRLELKVSQKDGEELYQNVLQKYAKSLQVPGFRKGKAPASVIENKYRPELIEEARGELINQAVEEATKSEDMHHAPLAYSPTILSGKPAFNPKEDFSFAVEYDVFPDVQFANIEGFEVEVPDVSVQDEDIQDELNEIRHRNAIIVDKDDDALAETGDIVTLTYAELDEDGNEVEGSLREDFVITLGNGNDLYGMSELVPGMKRNETKEVEKTYPEDYRHESLAGKTVKLKITVTEIKREELPDLDDELAQDVSEKYQTLDDLKNDIRKDIAGMIDSIVTDMRNDALIEKIVEANSFDVPVSMVATELYRRWETVAARVGIQPEQLEKITAGSNRSKEAMYDAWRPDAEKYLKERIAIEKLIDQLQIDASSEDVEKEIEKMAEKEDADIDELKKHYADGRNREYLVDSIKERRLFERLAEKSTIKLGEKKTFGELPLRFRGF